MYTEGWIRLHRKLLEWEWYTDANTTRLWLHLLLTANWKKARFMGQEIERGELFTSIDNLSRVLKISKSQTRTALKHLENSKQIAIKSQTNGTLITIEKYAFFQGDDEDASHEFDTDLANKSQTNSKQIANKSQTNRNNIRKKEREEELISINKAIEDGGQEEQGFYIHGDFIPVNETLEERRRRKYGGAGL